ncbi:MAG: PEGA domain-containing protein [Candidatus Kuenenia sp.]|nr:PEGA domain-containing protein [Candidatus Kuenenia hertensis]
MKNNPVSVNCAIPAANNILKLLFGGMETMKVPVPKMAIMVNLVVFLFSLVFLPLSYSEGNVVGMIRKSSGKVWLLREGSKLEAQKAMELQKGDMLEVEDGANTVIVYYDGGRKEEYASKSLIEIGNNSSTILEGSAVTAQKKKEKKIILDMKDNTLNLPDRDIAHAGGQFIRGILPPKKYFEANNIQRYAVVIGISDYKDPKIPDLKYADKDAQAFYDFITSTEGGDFNKENVLLLKNEQATLKNVKLALTNFLKKAIDTDYVVIFMACHGEPEPDRPSNLYLLTHDSELASLSATAYHMENVNADMKRYILAKRLIFLADACHSAGLTEGSVGTRGFSNTINVAISELKSTREGWGIVSSCRAGEVSMESEKWGGGHGAFTYYLLEALKGDADKAGNNNGIVTLAETYDFLEEKVKRATQSAQHPDITGNFDNNLPLGFPGTDVPKAEKGKGAPKPRLGTVQIDTTPEGASVLIGGSDINAVTPATVKLAAGTYPVTIKKQGFEDVTNTVFINPSENTDVYFDLISRGTKENTTGAAIQNVQQEYAEMSAGNKESLEHKEMLKDNIDALIKELESIAKEQAKDDIVTDKKPQKKIQEVVAAEPTVPVSIKEFSVKMGALSNKRNMERLRQKIIDALISEKGLSVVERDLEFQEEILREQRLSGSVLADEMYRISLGKIQGAQFLCFSGVAPGDSPEQLTLRMEIVDTATTQVDTLEHVFNTEDNFRAIASTVASKIREKISTKRKL